MQPDICVCGGVLTMKKIAAMAEAQYMMVAPHNPMSPLATAINVHFAASTPNFYILEYTAPDSGARKNVLKEPLMVNKDGYMDIPNKPGWGVELNEEAFKSMPPAPGGAAPDSTRTARHTSSKVRPQTAAISISI